MGNGLERRLSRSIEAYFGWRHGWCRCGSRLGRGRRPVSFRSASPIRASGKPAEKPAEFAESDNIQICVLGLDDYRTLDDTDFPRALSLATHSAPRTFPVRSSHCNCLLCYVLCFADYLCHDFA